MKLAGKADIVIIAAALLLLAVLYAVFSGGGSHRFAVIEHDGKTLRVDMDALSEPERYTFECGDGMVIVVVSPEGAWFESSPCPDGICVAAGRLDSPGDTAVCLPCRVSLHIEGGDAPDGYTG
jgi:hypothetical protein